MKNQILYIFNSKLFRILSFLLIAVIVLKVIVFRIGKDDRDQRLKTNLEYLETLSEDYFDVLFFSNSYVFTAYDPLYLESLTGLKSMHFGTDARRFCFDPYIIKEVISKTAPKVVVLDISRSGMEFPENLKSWHFQKRALLNFDPSLSKAILLFKIIPSENKNYWFETFSNFSNSLYQLSKPYEKVDDKANTGRTLGFVDKKNQNTKLMNPLKKDFQNIYNRSISNDEEIFKTLMNDSYDMMLDFVKWTEQYPDVTFLFINSVKLRSNYENQLYLNQLKEDIGGRANLKVMEMNSSEVKNQLNLKFLDFHDPAHLSISGAFKTTNYLSKFLKKLKIVDLNYEQNSFELKSKSGDNIKFLDAVFLLVENQNKDVRLVADKSINVFKGKNVNIGVRVYPKEGKENLLSDYSKDRKYKYDAVIAPVDSATEIDLNTYVFKLNLNSKMNKDDIDYIMVFLYSKEGILTEKKIINL